MIVNALFIKPLDNELLDKISESGKKITVYTTDMKTNGLASLIMMYYSSKNIQVRLKAIGIGDNFVTHGSIQKLKEQQHISLDDLFQQLD